MGWLTGGLVACCTASLIVGSNGALEDTQNARSSRTRDSNGRLPILLRHELVFRNDTRVSETSAVHTDPAAFASTEMGSSISTPDPESPSSSLFPVPKPTTPLSKSSNAASTASVHYSTGAVSRNITKGAQTLSTISMPTVTPERVSKSKQTISNLPEVLASVNALRTATQPAVTSEPEPNTDSRSSTVSETGFSSQTFSTPLPTASTDFLSLIQSSLLNSSRSSLEVHVALTSASTSHPSPTLSTTTPMLSGASRTATALLFHSVSSLSNWSFATSSTADASNGSSSSFTTFTGSTLPTIIPEHTVSTFSKILADSSAPPSAAPNNMATIFFPSMINSEASVASAAWISLSFTWPDSQTVAISTTSSATPTLPMSSGVSSDSIFPAIVPTANSIAPSRSVTEPFTQTSLISIPTQTSNFTWTAEISNSRPISSSIFSKQPSTTIVIETASSVASPTFSVTSPTFTSRRNISTSRTTQGTLTLSPPVFPTGVKSSFTSSAGGRHTSRTSSLRLSATTRSTTLPSSISISSFVTRTSARSSEPPSQTISAFNDIKSTTTKSQSTVLPTSTPIETVAATAAPPLNPSETAGVVIGSTAGVLLAIVAALYVARRYHTMHAATYGSDDSSRAYPEIAYLYDPSISRTGSDSGGDDETSAFMSGGAGGLPPAPSGSKTPPRAPNNSLDYEYSQRYSTQDMSYSDPGNPFANAEDPFLDWRTSQVISTPSNNVSALAAAVTGYSKGPQKPLPPLPSDANTFQDHFIPSPTLSPLPNGCGLRRSHAGRNSVKSQRSLRKSNCRTLPNSSSREYAPLPQHARAQRQSLSSIHEPDNYVSVSEPTDHDLPLPVDIRSETPDSVIVYTSTPILNPSTQHRPILLPTVFSKTQTPDQSSSPAPWLRSTGSLLFPREKATAHEYSALTQETRRSLSSSSDDSINPDITYTDFPSPPASTRTISTPPPPPRNRGWADIKRISADYSMLMSPLATTTKITTPPPVHPFISSPRASASTPPPPLHKRPFLVPFTHNAKSERDTNSFGYSCAAHT